MTRHADPGGMKVLREWGDELRQRRRTIDYRWRVVAKSAAAAALLLLPYVLGSKPILIWNVTASAPTGLYLVLHPSTLRRRQMVAARVPLAFRIMAAKRGYIPSSVPLIKQVVGVPGDTICGVGRTVRLSGKTILGRLPLDAAGRLMPQWQGCMKLGTDDYFLANPAVASSFDGRYFGASKAADIIGVVHLLWPQ